MKAYCLLLVVVVIAAASPPHKNSPRDSEVGSPTDPYWYEQGRETLSPLPALP